MSYLDKIDEFCAQSRISRTRFEKEAGLSKGLISKWRIQGITPGMDSLKKVSARIGIPLNDLMREDAADIAGIRTVPDNWTDGPDVVRDASLEYIPVYRHIDPESDSLNPDLIELHFAVMPGTLTAADECFGYTITDSSMAPDILRGDVVIVRMDNDPDTGDIVLVSTPGKETICRKLIKHADYIILQPFNSHYDSVMYRYEEFDFLPVFFRGKVVSVIRSIRSSAGSVPEM